MDKKAIQEGGQKDCPRGWIVRITREDGVEFCKENKGQNLIFKGITFKSKGNDSIVRLVKREED